MVRNFNSRIHGPGCSTAGALFPMKPSFESVPMETGLHWRGGNFLYQEKSDGCHEFAEVAGMVVNAERMHDGSLVVNDLVTLHGQDVRGEPTRARWAELVSRARTLPRGVRLSRIGSGGEFLEHLLSEGGEGIVVKTLDAPFGVGWLKCKRQQVFLCVVVALDHSKGSVSLCDAATGQERGKLPLRSRFDQIRVGSVLKLEAYGLTVKGLLREARVDKDSPSSWLVQF
jgi:hypothetical protein